MPPKQRKRIEPEKGTVGVGKQPVEEGKKIHQTKDLPTQFNDRSAQACNAFLSNDIKSFKGYLEEISKMERLQVMLYEDEPMFLHVDKNKHIQEETNNDVKIIKEMKGKIANDDEFKRLGIKIHDL
jgi:hypothetical protein